VIRPVNPKFLGCGSRVILKSKNEKFSEKSKEKKPNLKPLSENLQKIVDDISCYVTENRLRNVLSHIGTVTKKDFGKIMGVFVKDIMDDYMKDFGDTLNTLEKIDRKSVNKLINSMAANLIRSNFLNIVDGVF
jgi:Rnl2 family RNA ligase